MRIIIKIFPEINVKSTSVRLHFIKILNKNIYSVLKNSNCIKKTQWYWDYIEILLSKDDSVLDIVEVLIRIPGIHHVLLAKKYFFNDISDIFKKVISIYCYKLIGKSFCIRVKRHGVHSFTSHDLECYLGNMLCKSIKGTFVKLTNPEEIISLDVKMGYFLLLKNRYEGLCGFPIGTQGEVLSLISGGFDSAVSSYMSIRRGCKVHYCFFRFGGDLHENEVYKIVYYLWEKFGSSHSVKFISVDFLSVLNEILTKISNSLMGIILKRMMIRASTFIAKRLKISALVTGEVLGQVSSQTLINLKLINDVTDIMIFRPLITYDKEDIITLSRKIGIEHFSNNIPEYCGIISKKPTAKASKDFIESEEKKFNFSILHESINEKKIVNIRELILKDISKKYDIKFISKLNCEYIIIDIRRQEEKNIFLFLDVVEVKRIPFYKLFNIFSTLDQSKMYLLYCGKGIMSHYYVMRLRDLGFINVNVYLP